MDMRANVEAELKESSDSDGRRLDWEAFRAEFPALDRITYLNAAGGGPIPRAAAAAGQRYYQESLDYGDLKWADWVAAADETRARLAGMLNAAPHEIAFVQHASLGLNHVAAMLAGPEAGALAPSDEFPSVSLAWLNRGAPLQTLPIAPDGSLEEIDALDPSIRWLLASHVQYSSGVRLDLDALRALADRHELGLILDVTQSFGVTPIDVRAQRIDAMAFSLYKWAAAGYGAGVLYLRDGLLEEYGYPAAGWRTAAEPNLLIADRLTATGAAKELELGHPPIPAVLALGETLKLFERYGVAAIESRIASLTDRLHGELEAAGYRIVSPRVQGRRAGITVIEAADAKRAAQDMKDNGVFISARAGKLRISLHAYNDEADIAALMAALARFARP
ncbi:MAG: aminotransferase class V-fold PLP-dependent enzyme [Alphaproteobacteria bacterium]|nr:aminotransferase class V-fold PLP-dependent enzyme [Alphaproteobacteria bacterium]